MFDLQERKDREGGRREYVLLFFATFAFFAVKIAYAYKKTADATRHRPPNQGMCEIFLLFGL